MGVRKGLIIHVEDAVAVITKVLHEIEDQVGVGLKRINVGITGSHVHTMPSSGVVAVRQAEIRGHDLKRVVEAAQAVAVPSDREILHVIPQNFTVDGQSGIKDPLGMSGVRLEARVQIVTVSSHSAQNLLKCVNRCGYSVAEMIFNPIPLAKTILTADELEQGVCVVDIGAGTTLVALFRGGVLAAASVIPIGGQHVTNDLAAGLRTAIRDAEELKLKLDLDSAEMNEVFSIPELGRDEMRAIPGAKLRQIVHPRLEELFSLVNQEIRVLSESADLGGLRNLTGGVVLTGGTARLKGITKVADEVLKIHSRVKCDVREGVVNGLPHKSIDKTTTEKTSGSKDHDNFLVACGLALFNPYSSMIFNLSRSQPKSEGWLRRASNWLTENF
jgi:cell division protein FtsA